VVDKVNYIVGRYLIQASVAHNVTKQTNTSKSTS